MRIREDLYRARAWVARQFLHDKVVLDVTRSVGGRVAVAEEAVDGRGFLWRCPESDQERLIPFYFDRSALAGMEAKKRALVFAYLGRVFSYLSEEKPKMKFDVISCIPRGLSLATAFHAEVTQTDYPECSLMPLIVASGNAQVMVPLEFIQPLGSQESVVLLWDALHQYEGEMENIILSLRELGYTVKEVFTLLDCRQKGVRFPDERELRVRSVLELVWLFGYYKSNRFISSEVLQTIRAYVEGK